MNLKINILVIGVLFCTFFSYSQNAKPYNRAQFIKDSIEIMRARTVRPQVRLDNRFAFYKGQIISLNGYDAGVMLKDKIRLTLGYYHLDDNLMNYNMSINNIDYIQKLSMNYGSINFEFVYKENRWITLGMPIEVGVGTNSLKTLKKDSLIDYSTEKGLMAILDFGLSGTFKPINWIGIRTVVGYRKNFLNLIPDHKFNGFFASVGLSFDIQTIFRDYKMMRLKIRHKKFGNALDETIDMIME